MQDLFAKLSGSIISEIGIGGVPQFAALDGPMPRRELQRAYVDRLCDFVANTPPGTPEDAVALARLYLTKHVGHVPEGPRLHRAEDATRCART